MTPKELYEKYKGTEFMCRGRKVVVCGYDTSVSVSNMPLLCAVVSGTINDTGYIDAVITHRDNELGYIWPYYTELEVLFSTYEAKMDSSTDTKEVISVPNEGGETCAEAINPNLISPMDMQVGGNHYKKYPIQPATFLHVNKVGWLEGDAINYILRHRDKNGREDIEKAIHLLTMLLEMDYKQSK